MARPRAPRSRRTDDPDAIFSVAKRRPVPYEFVLDALAAVEPTTRPMFGSTAVYADDKIVLCLREKGTDADDGVWVCTEREHHAALRWLMPSLRSIEVFGVGETRWQIIPADAPDFEESVLKVCKLIAARDPRIGRVPKPRRKRPAAAVATKKMKSR